MKSANGEIEFFLLRFVGIIHSNKKQFDKREDAETVKLKLVRRRLFGCNLRNGRSKVVSFEPINRPNDMKHTSFRIDDDSKRLIGMNEGD